MMKAMRKAGKAMMVAMSAIITMMLVVSLAGAATREENVQKIERFLSNDVVNRGISERGETYERVMRNVNTMSDTQVEKLAEHATTHMQVGGALESSQSEFWAIYGLYILLVALPLIILLALA